MKKIFKFIGYILLTLVITLSVYIFVVSEVLKKDYVNIFGYTYFTVATDSMTGTIDINDIIIVKLDDDVNTNDISVNSANQSVKTNWRQAESNDIVYEHDKVEMNMFRDDQEK